MRLLPIYSVIVLLLGVLAASPLHAAKLKHRSSLYSDSTEKSLKLPEGVACGDDTLIVADTGNSQVVRYRLSEKGIAPDASFPLPDTSLLVAQLGEDGSIYLLDGKSRQILTLNSSGQPGAAIVPQGVPGSKTIIPRSFRLSGGQLYLLDIFSSRLLILDLQGKFQRQLPFPDGSRFLSDLAIGPQGSIYLLDSVAGTIYRAAPSSEAFSLFSDNLKRYLNFPTSLTVASNGGLYLSDQYGSGLVAVGQDGSFQGRKYGSGWEDGQLYYPSQICSSRKNFLAIADRSNSRVQVFSILDE